MTSEKENSSSQIILGPEGAIEYEKGPAIKKYKVELPPPNLEDPIGDFERIKKALEDLCDSEIKNVDCLVQKNLPDSLRNELGEDLKRVVLTVWNDKEIIGVDPEDELKAYGLALDLGTTTVVGYLMDLEGGEVVSHSSSLNPQTEFGDDLVSRVTFANQEEGGLSKVHEKGIEVVNKILEDACKEEGIETEDVEEIVCVGNTAMHHFFFGINPEYLAKSPYPPARQASANFKARDLGVDINPSGYVHWLPVNAGWVGPDNIAVLLAAQVYEEPETTVAIDVGTNAEVFVGSEEESYVCSTAAGGAFEGMQIKYGMRAAPGSIEKVSINVESLKPEYSTIEGEKPRGICGSGIVDVIAEMFRVGILDKTGKFRQELGDRSSRIRMGKDNIWEYVLARRDECSINDDLVITQGDVREIQKSKGAVQAGARVLMDKLGVKKVDRVVLAGAFGSYVDEKSARTIGLFPECPLENVKKIGNAAGAGAKLVLMSREKRDEAKKIPEKVEFVELAGTDEFRNHFLNTMHFPHTDESLYPQVMEEIRDSQKNLE